MFFVFRTGGYQQEFIWVLASNVDLLDYAWHFCYSYRSTEVLGKLACLILSKILGIGSAERHWKDVKRVASSSGRYKLDSDKVKMESTLVGQHCAAKSARCRESQSKAGKLWTEDDFETLRLDRFGVDVDKLKNPTPRPQEIFRACRETWESVKLT